MKKWIIAVATPAVALACVGAPTAVAAPQGVYSVFAQCPAYAEGVEGCLYASLEGGYIRLGKTVVPIARTVAVQGGFVSEEESGMQRLVGALDGEPLAKVEQMLPGGLLGMPLGVVAELAGPASSISFRPQGEVSLTLPVKIRLVNPQLGAECSLGSNSHPIELSVTSGTTSAGLTGERGETASTGKGRVLVIHGILLVGSGFAIPKASGCGLAVVDEIIDAILGLPSSKNTAAVFDMKLEQTSVDAVRESEG